MPNCCCYVTVTVQYSVPQASQTEMVTTWQTPPVYWRRVMERILTIGKSASGLLGATVICQTGIALLFMYLANATNTRGLGVAAL